MGRMALEPNPKYDNLWYLKDKKCHLNLTPGKPAKIWISGHICLHKQQAVQMLLENSHNLHLTMFVGTLTAFFGESTTASKNGIKINHYHWDETQKCIFCDSKPSKEQQFFLKRTSFLSTHPFLNPHFVLSSTILPGTWNISHVFIKGQGFFLRYVSLMENSTHMTRYYPWLWLIIQKKENTQYHNFLDNSLFWISCYTAPFHYPSTNNFAIKVQQLYTVKSVRKFSPRWSISVLNLFDNMDYLNSYHWILKLITMATSLHRRKSHNKPLLPAKMS